MSEELSISQLYALTQQYLEQRDYARAQDLAWQQMDIDPLYEPALRQLMTALAKSGQRSAAMAQYEIYRKRLGDTSEAEPSAELAELYQRIQNDELQQTMLRHPSPSIPDTTTINPIFCYTDIESSTRLWDEHREAMLWALRQHNDLCETEIEQYDGRILHPTGDGFLIVFEQNDPLQFAISLQQQFALADWGEIGELRIRIGFHGATAGQEGHEFFRDGDWYRGSVLNHAARIADTGHGGQIVASPMVVEYCPLPPGASWEDLGEHGLKSLDEKQQIYGLLHPDLNMQSFPALRTPTNKKKAQVGSHIRGYELGSMIGQGAFGEVYHAQQPGVGRPVAVKKIRSRFANQPEFIRRFEAEAQVIARLEHPHIVPLYDYWREADGAYLVMRYMRGGSLKASLEAGALDLAATLALVDQVGSALAFSHQQGFVHRDIKPANILLDETGNGYLSDFGIVKDLEKESEEASSDSITGTPAYLSPEQALGQPVSALSDQYSLGVMLYEILTGLKPFDDTSTSKLIAKQLEEPLPLVSPLHPTIPPAVDEVIQRSTAKNADSRFDGIPAMIRALHLAAQKDGSGFALPADFVQLEEELVNPYKGLRSFQEADAVNFFGRRALVAQLLSRFSTAPESSEIPTDRFLAVVGPSGSGKSSAVKAGLLPALRRGAVPGSEKWFMVEMIPGLNPLEELEVALLRIAIDPPDSLVNQLREDEQGLGRVLEQVLPEDGSELLLMIDQFEELYTLVEDDEQRTHFINSLLAALQNQNSRLRVVVTIRADFYDRPLMTPGLAELMRNCTEIVPPLNKMELEEVIVQPALQVGAMFETGLVPAIIDDVSEQPGALPLLQYALTELFERRQERLLTRAAYEEIGGVLGALGRRAEELYTDLDKEGEEAARQMFMRLVTLGEGTEDTRRRVLRSELTGLSTALGKGEAPDPARDAPLQNDVMETVINAYGRYRLLTFDRDPLTREPTVEVAHEALLRDWPRLRQWLEESRDDVRLQRRLSAAVAEWVQANQSDDYLLRGSRLDLFIGWFATTQLALTSEEQAFLDASESAHQQRQAEEDARLQRELETAQQLAREQTQRAEEQEAAAQRLRRRALLLTGALVVAALLAIAAVFFANQSNRNAATAAAETNQRATAQAVAEEQRGVAETEAESRATAQALAEANETEAVAQQATAEAEAQIRATAEAIAVQERETAEEQTRLTRSRELSLASQNMLEEDPQLSILLALEGLNTTYTREANDALHKAILSSRVLGRISDHEGAIFGTDFSPDGSLLATAGADDGTIKLRDPESGETLRTLTRDGYFMPLLTFSPDSQQLAATFRDEPAPRLGSQGVVVWDILTGEELWSVTPEETLLGEIAYSPDGQRLAAVKNGNGLPGFVVWDAATGAELLNIASDQDGELDQFYHTIDFSPDGQLLSTSSSLTNQAAIYDAATGEQVTSFTHPAADGFEGNILAVAFHPDGQRFATLTYTGDVYIWDIDSGEQLAAGKSILATTPFMIFTPDGEHLIVWGEDFTHLSFLDVETGDEALQLPGLFNGISPQTVAFSPDGQRLFSPLLSEDALFLDLGPPRELANFMLVDGESARSVFNPDQTLIASVTDSGLVNVRAVSTGELLWEVQGHDEWAGGRDFSPDGTLLATGGDEGMVAIWDVATGELLNKWTAAGDWVNAVRFSPDGSQLATANEDNTFKIFDPATGELILSSTYDGALVGVDYGPTGELAVPNRNHAAKTVEIWDPSTGEILRTIETGITPFRVLVDPAGEWLAVNSVGTVEIYNLKSGESMNTIEAHETNIIDLGANSDGTMLATGAYDNEVRIWDPYSGQLLHILPVGFYANFFEFSPDNKIIHTVAGEGRMGAFALDPDDLMALAEERVTRDLTTAECNFYRIDPCPTK